MKQVVFISGLLLIFSCHHESHKRTNKVVAVTVTDSPKNGAARKHKETLLMVSTANHAFSDISAKDSFVLKLVGASMLTGQVDFQIYKSNHVIYHESFSAFDLLGDEADAIPTDRQKEDTIAKRMKDFFGEDSFIQPAIKLLPVYDEDHLVDRQIWEEIKSDSTAIGFLYSYGYEGVYGIAYSKQKARTVCFYSGD